MRIRITWKLGPEFPDLVKGGAMGIVDGVVVHVAGMTYPWRENETGWWLDPRKEDWQPLPPLPVGMAYTMGVSGEDALFVVGGRRKGLPRSDAFGLSEPAGGGTGNPSLNSNIQGEFPPLPYWVRRRTRLAGAAGASAPFWPMTSPRMRCSI